MNLRFILLALIQTFWMSRMLGAQLPPRLERCLPYPTLAQGIRAMREEASPSEPEPARSPKVVIASIQFVPEIQIPEPVRGRILSSIKSPTFYDDSERDWLTEMQDIGIRGALQDSGFFKVKVNAEARLIDRNEGRSRYALTLHIDTGQQYRLGDVHFESVAKNPLVYPASELRRLIPLDRGEIFNVSKVREGMREISKLYAAKGYIDMVPEPEVVNDEGDGPVEVIMKIDEGKQYRIRKIEFLGLDEKAQNQLRPQLKPGDVYDEDLVEQLLKGNKPVLPSDVSRRDLQLTRDTKYGMVDMRFDFYSCPKMDN
jgi:outer membrane translocation and assembly module TamA